MTGRDRDFVRIDGSDDRSVGRRTILGFSLAGLAGAGFPGTALARQENLPNELVIESRTNRVEYTIAVDGRIEFGDEAGDGDEIEGGTTVTGVINGAGQDDYRFSGEITAFDITEGADATRVRLNGDTVDPADLGSDDQGGDQEFPHSITISARTEQAEYELAVDGRLSRGPGDGGQIEERKRVTSTLEGDEEHTYRFWGIGLVLEIPEGSAGFSVTLADDGSTADDRLAHRLFVYGLGDPVTYRFTVSEALEFGDAAETEDTDLPADERIDENTVEGHVHAHDGDPLTDDYRFADSIEFEHAEGPVRVRLKPNDEREETGGSNE